MADFGGGNLRRDAGGWKGDVDYIRLGERLLRENTDDYATGFLGGDS